MVDRFQRQWQVGESLSNEENANRADLRGRINNASVDSTPFGGESGGGRAGVTETEFQSRLDQLPTASKTVRDLATGSPVPSIGKYPTVHELSKGLNSEQKEKLWQEHRKFTSERMAARHQAISDAVVKGVTFIPDSIRGLAKHHRNTHDNDLKSALDIAGKEGTASSFRLPTFAIGRGKQVDSFHMKATSGVDYFSPFDKTEEASSKERVSKLGETILPRSWSVGSITSTLLDFCVPSAFGAPSKETLRDISICKRPYYEDAVTKLERVKTFDDISSVIGGKVKLNFDAGYFENGCAIRMSYVLNQTGCDIPKIPEETVSGRDGKQYIYRLTALRNNLIKRFGPPDCEWHGDGSKPTGTLGSEVCSEHNMHGILIHKFSGVESFTGHAELGENLSVFKSLDRGVFWALPRKNDNGSMKEDE